MVEASFQLPLVGIVLGSVLTTAYGLRFIWGAFWTKRDASGEKLPTTVRLDEDLRTAVSTMFRHDVTWLACVHEGRYHGYMSLRGVSKLLSRAYEDND